MTKVSRLPKFDGASQAQNRGIKMVNNAFLSKLSSEPKGKLGERERAVTVGITVGT